MVAGFGQAFSTPSSGRSEWGKMLAGHFNQGRSSDTSTRAAGPVGDLESGQEESRRGTIAEPVRDEVQGGRTEPPGDPAGGPAGQQAGGGSRSGASQAGASVPGGDPSRREHGNGSYGHGGDPAGGGQPFGGGFPGGFRGGFPGGPGGGGPPGPAIFYLADLLVEAVVQVAMEVVSMEGSYRRGWVG